MKNLQKKLLSISLDKIKYPNDEMKRFAYTRLEFVNLVGQGKKFHFYNLSETKNSTKRALLEEEIIGVIRCYGCDYYLHSSNIGKGYKVSCATTTAAIFSSPEGNVSERFKSKMHTGHYEPTPMKALTRAVFLLSSTFMIERLPEARAQFLENFPFFNTYLIPSLWTQNLV